MRSSVPIPSSEIVGIRASHDVCGGGTGLEFKENLVKDGQESWNKWYSNQRGPWSLQFDFDAPKTILGYTVKSANDMPPRDPKAWVLRDLAGSRTLHTTTDEHFQSRWQKQTYYLAEPCTTRGVELLIVGSHSGTECQIGQIEFLRDPSAADNAMRFAAQSQPPAAFGIPIAMGVPHPGVAYGPVALFPLQPGAYPPPAYYAAYPLPAPENGQYGQYGIARPPPSL